ncbi:MAG: hypothetical protein AAF361_15650, partial [Bacteroidota bacterium]
MASDRVYAVKKGEDGFLWMATHQGLCRFDGSQFMYYNQKNSSIIDDRVIDVLPAGNQIWAATEVGLSVLDVVSGEFKNYQLGPMGKVDSLFDVRTSEIYRLFLDRDKEVWVGSRYHGLFQFVPEQDDFKSFQYTGDVDNEITTGKSGRSQIMTISASRTNDSLIYAGTLLGLLEVNKYSGQVEWYAFSPKDYPEIERVNVFREIYFHKDGKLYEGARTPGLRVFDPKTKTIALQKLTPGPGNKILDRGIANFYPKSRNEFWVTTSEGMAVYNSKEQGITFFKENQVRKGIYYGVECVDEQNRIWFPATNGLHCFDPMVQQFRVYSYEHLNNFTWGFANYVVKNPTKEVLTVFPRNSDGLFHLDLASETWTKTDFPGKYVTARSKETQARGMAVDPDGNYTLASAHGLFTYYPKTGGIRPLSIPTVSAEDRYTDVFWDSRGWLWLGLGTRGVVRWDPYKREVRGFTKALLDNDPQRDISQVGRLMEDNQGNIWFRRVGGMGGYLAAKDTLINFLYDNDEKNNFRVVNSIAEDRN